MAYRQKGTSTSVNVMVTVLQFLYIQVHLNHVTQRIYRITAMSVGRHSAASFVISGVVFSQR